MELRWQIEQLNDIAVVRCSGRLVRGAALDEFQSRLERLDSARILVLDLCEVDQVDAGGIGVLLELRGWARQHSAQVKLVNPAPFVRRVLEATHLNSIFEISSLEQALSILRASNRDPHFAIA
jgi:anti-anti-sigma factor